MRLHTAFLTSLLRRHILGMGLTASALSTTPAAKGAIRYRQLWVGADGVTHIDEQQCGKLETKDFTSTGGDAALQYVRAFSDSDDFALTGLVVTQQVGENPWHFCPSPQFVVTLEGSWYIRTSDGKTTTFKPGDVLYQDNSAEHPLVRRGVLKRADGVEVDAIDATQPVRRRAGQTRSERASTKRRAALERRERRALQPTRPRREA